MVIGTWAFFFLEKYLFFLSSAFPIQLHFIIMYIYLNVNIEVHYVFHKQAMACRCFISVYIIVNRIILFILRIP